MADTIPGLGVSVPGLAKPWQWHQPRTDAELIMRLIQARDYNVHERERENLCSVAADRLRVVLALQDAIQAALDTEETDDDIIRVARDAHAAELELWSLKHKLRALSD